MRHILAVIYLLGIFFSFLFLKWNDCFRFAWQENKNEKWKEEN